jgi:16S rRNA (uracil1498-N3)-methyltransferase
MVSPQDLLGGAGSDVVLDKEEAHHAVAVLRTVPGDIIVVTDGAGTTARCAVSATDGGRVVARVIDRQQTEPISPHVVVYTGAAKGSKVDGVIERLGEIGVREVFVYSSERTVVSWDAVKRARVTKRWRSIACSVAKQSRNPFVMATSPPLAWSDLIERIRGEPLPVVLWEEATVPLRAALDKSAERIGLVIGPEGGLTPAEAEELADAGGQLVTLGPRILRTENAPIVAASAVLYHCGAIG